VCSSDLPLHADSAAYPAPAGPAPIEGRLGGQRVYLVDDEPEIQRSMKSLLELWGLTVFTAGSERELNTQFRSHGPPDLLIADLRLGDGEHGASLARRLLDEYPRLAVLIITGETSSEALQDANREGLPLLQKPITPESLRAAIVTALSGVRTPSQPAGAG
jgi:DNA-binding NtrC family response regulator